MSFALKVPHIVAAAALSFAAVGSAFANATITVMPVASHSKAVKSIGIYAKNTQNKQLVSKCAAYNGRNVTFKDLPFNNNQVFNITGYANATCQGKPVRQRTVRYTSGNNTIILP